MKIILSAHFDLNKPVKYIKIDSQKMTGLIDNFAGVFTAYQASRNTGVDLYLTNFEEINLGGAIALAKDLKDEKLLVIVVDTCTDVGDKDAYLGNVYNFDVSPLKKKFSKYINFKDEFVDPTEDETAIYGWDYHFPTFYFGIPISGNYHDVDNKISLEMIDKSARILTDVINFLQEFKD